MHDQPERVKFSLLKPVAICLQNCTLRADQKRAKYKPLDEKNLHKLKTKAWFSDPRLENSQNQRDLEIFNILSVFFFVFPFFILPFLAQIMKNPIKLKKEKSWGQTETRITRDRCLLTVGIIYFSSIGVLCPFFVPPIFRATFTSGHVGDEVVMMTSLISRHGFWRKLPPWWWRFQKNNVELWGYKVTLLLY